MSGIVRLATLSYLAGMVASMPVHIVTSAGWGELQVEALPEPERFVRPWRATLQSRPARLGHIIAVHGDEKQDVVEHMLRYVDSFESQPMRRRRAEHPI